jgi:hypothetical protein
MLKGLRERELLLKGADADDLVSLRMFQWVRDHRDQAREREEALQDALSEFDKK